MRFLSVKTPEHAHAEGLKACIEDSFHYISITTLHTQLASLNINGTAINTGIHSGLEVKFKEADLWISSVHCFNHRLELAVKDTSTILFLRLKIKDIDTMLLKLYYLYCKSPKRLRELKSFSKMYENTIPKPYKSYGTR